MTEPFLELRGIVKHFGSTPVLRGIDLTLAADELLVVLGPTGAGKTTLLRTIAGLEQADAGELWLAGNRADELPPRLRDVALVFQNFSLYPHWSVHRNMAYPLRAPGRDLSRQEIDRQVRWAAALLHIEHLLERNAARLSGGEMQRVAIGRAIVRRPRLFLMDEPLSNLDAKLREELRVELVRLRRELRTPMVFVTHDQTEALSMADRIAVMAAGAFLQSGTPETVYQQPNCPAVALQLGQPRINLFPVVSRAGAWHTAAGAVIAPSAAPADSRATIGVRPEQVRLNGGSRPGTVRVVERMGPETIVLIDWAGQQIHVLGPRDLAVAVGDRVCPAWDASALLLWPAAA